MAATASTTAMIPGDPPLVLLDEPLFELVNGIEVNQPAMGTYANVIASILGGELYAFLKQSALGQVAVEALFRMHPARTTMRRPDVAYVSFARWPRERDITPGNGWEVVPELAVEVVSPTDLAVEVMAKVYEYLDAGVLEVWLVYPELRRVHRFAAGGAMAAVGPEGTLDGGVVLPGFQLTLADLFRNRA